MTPTPRRDRDLLKIGEFARLSGTSAGTLRYYEELGLLRPVVRRPGGTRFFERSQLDRIAAIRRLQTLGLSLEWMARSLFQDNDGDAVAGPELLTRLRAGLRQQIVLTRLRVQSLHQELRELERSYEKLNGRCLACDIPFSQENCDPCPEDAEPLSAAIRALL